MKLNNKPLVVASLLCAAAALAHLGCIVFGGDWYRFFGAGDSFQHPFAAGCVVCGFNAAIS
jgi:hypothetical protein